MEFIYEGWTLYQDELIRKDGTEVTFYFFQKRRPPTGIKCSLPDGYKVRVNKRTGLPYLKKK